MSRISIIGSFTFLKAMSDCQMLIWSEWIADESLSKKSMRFRWENYFCAAATILTHTERGKTNIRTFFFWVFSYFRRNLMLIQIFNDSLSVITKVFCLNIETSRAGKRENMFSHCRCQKSERRQTSNARRRNRKTVFFTLDIDLAGAKMFVAQCVLIWREKKRRETTCAVYFDFKNIMSVVCRYF